MKLDREEMRKRFAELGDKVEKIRAKSGPLRDKRDAKIKVHMDFFLRDANAEIAKAEKGLFDLENERAMIARALGHKGVGPTEDEAEKG